MSELVRLFIFDNRIEIVSPGHLPDSLTVEKILAGNSNIRNPILVSYMAKGLLPYHGLGSGIQRALDAWPQIDFIDNRDGCLFFAKVHRKPVDELTLSSGSPKGSPKTEQRIIELIRQDPYTTTAAMGEILSITKRAVLKQINKLKKQHRLRRVGPARGALGGDRVRKVHELSYERISILRVSDQ